MEIPKTVGIGILIGILITIVSAIYNYISTTKEREERKDTVKRIKEEAVKKDGIFLKKKI